MPRKTKAIPDNRAEWTFGEAVFWHFFVFGTRPDIRPTDRRGRIWAPQRAAGDIGVSVRTLWNWVDDSHLPYDTTGLERVLFDRSPLFDEWRIELQTLLRTARAPKTKKPNEPASPRIGTSLVPTLTGQAVTVFESPEFEDDTVQILEKIGKDRAKAALTGWFSAEKNSEAPSGPAIASGPSRPSGPTARQKGVALVAGAVLIIGGFAVSRVLKTDTPPTVVVKNEPPVPPIAPPPVEKASLPVSGPPAGPKAPSAAEQRAAAEKQRQDDQRTTAQKKTLDDLEALRVQKENAARDLNAKLKVMAQGDDDLCKQKLAGLSVPGFTLKCDTLIPFGKMLGAVPVSQTASSLGDCATRCRKVKDCVAFSFDAGSHAGSASCYLTGSIPEMRKADNWISGTR